MERATVKLTSPFRSRASGISRWRSHRDQNLVAPVQASEIPRTSFRRSAAFSMMPCSSGRPLIPAPGCTPPGRCSRHTTSGHFRLDSIK